jgi:trehalose 6-phosphate phosphatase
MIYLFGEEGLAALDRFIDRKTLFAFDLDGTLAPIVADPDDIRVPYGIRNALAQLAGSATVAVITGRSRDDALPRLGFIPRYVVGNHGAEGLPGKERSETGFTGIVDGWFAQLQRVLPAGVESGIFIENKGTTLSVHYRASRDRRSARLRVLSGIESLAPKPRRITGKYVENLIPEGCPNKGDALLFLLMHAGCHKGFFIGDDVTDEDVFGLDEGLVFTIRVGYSSRSRAKYYLRRLNEIQRMIDIVVSRLNKRKQ